jgi:hypothetical protein
MSLPLAVVAGVVFPGQIAPLWLRHDTAKQLRRTFTSKKQYPGHIVLAASSLTRTPMLSVMWVCGGVLPQLH